MNQYIAMRFGHKALWQVQINCEFSFIYTSQLKSKNLSFFTETCPGTLFPRSRGSFSSIFNSLNCKFTMKLNEIYTNTVTKLDYINPQSKTASWTASEIFFAICLPTPTYPPLCLHGRETSQVMKRKRSLHVCEQWCCLYWLIKAWQWNVLVLSVRSLTSFSRLSWIFEQSARTLSDEFVYWSWATTWCYCVAYKIKQLSCFNLTRPVLNLRCSWTQLHWRMSCLIFHDARFLAFQNVLRNLGAAVFVLSSVM